MSLSSNPTSPKSPRLIENEESSSSSSSLSIANEIEEMTIENTNNGSHEKVDVANYFGEIINKAPPGQISHVTEYCKKLSSVFGEKIEEAIELAGRNRIIQDGLLVKIKGNEESKDILITSDNFNGEPNDLIIDNSNFRFISESLVELTNSSDEDEGEFGKELRSSFIKYVQELYKNTGNVSIQKIDESSWKVHIIGSKSNCKSFWSGHWHSEWNIKLLEDDFIGIDGKIKLNAHFHEEGSVQLAAEKVIQCSKLKFAENVAKSIEKIYWKVCDTEDAVQVALNEAYRHLSETSFKRLRRQLPISRTKMDWAKFANYKIGDELKK